MPESASTTLPRGLGRAISEEEVRAYREDGIVCIRQAFDAGWVAHLRRAVEADMANPSPMLLDINRGGSGNFFGDTFVWQHIDAFRPFIFESPAAEIMATLFGSSKVNLLFDQILVKEPGTSTPTLWHHDATYWPVAGFQVATLWLALDPVNAENGAVEYVKGSHLWGERYAPQSFTGDGRYQSDLPPLPDFEAMREELDIVQFEMQPGDVTVHNGLTIHAAPGNSTPGTRRRAYVTRWCGDDVTYDPRPGIQPMLYEPDIAAGGPLDCELFPKVWPRG